MQHLSIFMPNAKFDQESADTWLNTPSTTLHTEEESIEFSDRSKYAQCLLIYPLQHSEVNSIHFKLLEWYSVFTEYHSSTLIHSNQAFPFMDAFCVQYFPVQIPYDFY